MVGEGAPDIGGDIVRTPETDRSAIRDESSPLTADPSPTETHIPKLTPTATEIPTPEATDTSTEMPMPTPTPTSTETAVPPTPAPTKRPPGIVRKLLARVGFGRSVQKPLIEVKPPVAPGSEGRGVIDRGQLRQNLQQEPSQS